MAKAANATNNRLFTVTEKKNDEEERSKKKQPLLFAQNENGSNERVRPIGSLILFRKRFSVCGE